MNSGLYNMPGMHKIPGPFKQGNGEFKIGKDKYNLGHLMAALYGQYDAPLQGIAYFAANRTICPGQATTMVKKSFMDGKSGRRIWEEGGGWRRYQATQERLAEYLKGTHGKNLGHIVLPFKPRKRMESYPDFVRVRHLLSGLLAYGSIGYYSTASSSFPLLLAARLCNGEGVLPHESGAWGLVWSRVRNMASQSRVFRDYGGRPLDTFIRDYCVEVLVHSRLDGPDSKKLVVVPSKAAVELADDETGEILKAAWTYLLTDFIPPVEGTAQEVLDKLPIYELGPPDWHLFKPDPGHLSRSVRKYASILLGLSDYDLSQLDIKEVQNA